MGKRLLRHLLVGLLALLLAGMVVSAYAQEDSDTEADAVAVEAGPAETESSAQPLEYSNLDTVWMLVAGFLVFFMQAGFALVEAGFVQAKNVVNILMKNLFDLCIGAIVYWAIGFGIMFGEGNAFFGTEWFFVDERISGDFAALGLSVPVLAFFFFQFAFAATAATIASGAMAGRTEFKGYLLYSGLVTAFIYPIVGHWIWGGGWLAQLDTPFADFAGSTVVHSTGAWVGLVGAILLGARKNRFGENAIPMPGHDMSMATLGVFILWLGWFGFNPGSQLNSDAASIAHITVTTNLAAAVGAMVAMGLGWLLDGKPQLPWALNGALAGLVAITAGCAAVTPAEALLIGALGSAVMYATVTLMERFRLDDPVGAVAVHGAAGVWGTLAVGLFHADTGLLHGAGAAQLLSQFIGVGAVAAFVLGASVLMFSAIRVLGILRVSEEGEAIGLDIYEHGAVGYPEFANSPSEPTPSF